MELIRLQTRDNNYLHLVKKSEYHELIIPLPLVSIQGLYLQKHHRSKRATLLSSVPNVLWSLSTKKHVQHLEKKKEILALALIDIFSHDKLFSSTKF